MSFDTNSISFDLINNNGSIDIDTINLILKSSGLNSNELSNKYFSKSNITFLQKLLRYKVKKTSNITITCDQNEQSLITVMINIFIDNALFLPYDLKKQIIDLNNKTINSIFPTVISNIYSRYKFNKYIDISKREMLPLPVSETKKKSFINKI